MNHYNHYARIDWFRLVAALLVIAIHTAPFASLSPDLDVVITYGLGRVAVPFFLMTTGYFVLAPYVGGGFLDNRKYRKFLGKNLILYDVSILLYLPVMWYARKLPKSVGELVRMLVFDGTFYHLWYFPALLMGSVFLIWVLKKCSMKGALIGTSVLYLIGLFGDSYYGLISNMPFVSMIYEGLFFISSYTRNGIFYAPLFLLMGIWMAKGKYPKNRVKCQIGLFVGLMIMLLESYFTDKFNLQRHNSMYLVLPVVMYFLYPLLFKHGGKAPAFLRSGTAFLYVIHPIGIILVRGLASRWKIEEVLVENSLIHYGMVCLISLCLCLCMMMVYLYLTKRRRAFVRKRQSMD